jgi:transposase
LEDAPQWLDDAIDMLEKGSGIVEIARRLQRGESTVMRWLKAAGIADPGKYAATVRIAMLEAQFAALTAQGYQVLDIAERTGASTTTVKRWRGGGRTPGGRPKTGGKFENRKRP